METLQVPIQTQELVFPRINFTDAQRKWIKRRDNFQCQHPSDHEHQGNLQIHHIIAQLYAQAYLGLTPEMVSMAENGITVCEGIHVGVDLRKPPHPEMLHPDHFEARREDINDRHSFWKVADRHRELAMKGIKYWFSDNDDVLLFQAIWRTRQEEKRYNHPYPEFHNGKR